MEKKLENKLKIKLKKINVEFCDLKFLAGDASNRKYFELKQGKKKNVLMYDSQYKNINNFLKITEILKEEVSVPEIIKDYKDEGMLIIENLGSKKYSFFMNQKNKKELYEVAVDALIWIHQKKKLPKILKYDRKEFLEESNLFFKWYLPLFKSKERINHLEKKFELLFNKFLNTIFLLPEVFVHRDYHIDNLFFLRNRKRHFKCGWIDYQDAVIGPCAYDLVSLTQDARIDVSRRLEKVLIDRYLSCFPKIDRELFAFSYSVIAIQRHLKVLGIFSRLFVRDKKKEYLCHIPRVLRMLKLNVEKKEFSDLHNFLKPMIYEKIN